MTHHNNLKSLIYFRVYSQCSSFYGFGQMYVTYTYDYNIIQSIFTAINVFYAPPNHLSAPSPMPIFYLYKFAFFRIYRVEIIKYMAFSECLMSLTNRHLSFLLSFLGLIAHFILALSSSPLFESTTVYLSIHLLKNIFVASKFWQF